MTLFVDFNMEDDRGRVPALLDPETRSTLRPGDHVLAEDDEGNRCKAYVADISPDRPVAFLALLTSTWERPKAQKSALA